MIRPEELRASVNSVRADSCSGRSGVERAIPDSLAETAWRLAEPGRLPPDLRAGLSPPVRRGPMSPTRTRLDPRRGSARPRLPGANERLRVGGKT
jgi:hypothetical protein